jgi:hypothetical protein
VAPTSRRPHWARLVWAMVLVVLLLAFGSHAALNVWPRAGARCADILRRIVGQRAVAGIETLALRVEDEIHRGMYAARGPGRASPWAHVRTASARDGEPTWMLSPLPSGGKGDEGVWEPYLEGPSGRVVALRTFLHPDPGRPYAVAAIVAFDLTATRLHFVLGSDEPRSSVHVSRPGRIPTADFRPGRLLAAFNGGFKTEHGHFGAMVAGTVVLPPRPVLGTVAIDAAGRVRLGSWGTSGIPSSSAVAWRQNGPLIVQDGRVNPHTLVYDPADWGVTVHHAAATWRSALGIAADGAILFYVAGTSLTLSALARAALDAGAAQAMQLDINNYWVHFDAFSAQGSRLKASPLLAAMRAEDDSRYLTGFGRDFFYITLAGPD